MNKKITIFLAEDHKLVRDAWKLTIEDNPHFSIIGEAETGSDALEFCSSQKVDIIIMDINLKDGSSVKFIKKMIDTIPNVKIIVVSMLNVYSIIKDLYKSGIKSFLTKNSSKEELIEAIQKVYNNEKYYSTEISQLLLERDNETINTLNSKEIKIIQLICDGLSNKEIGEQMKMSEKTIEGYKTKIFKKLKVFNNLGIYSFAQKNGLINS
ncbi:MAG: response regulator transcription factor [Flavobacteriales bacterium]|nr:response regulator transcription factor [Flavobacteriales bacterium]